MDFFDDYESERRDEDDVGQALEAALNEDEYDDDAVTPAEVLAQMTTAWQNERCAPMLLPHRYDLVDCLIEQITGMQENLRNDSQKNSLKHSIHQMEIYRIDFIVKDYIRERTKKLEDNSCKYLTEDDERRNSGKEELLDPRERRFAESYFKNLKTLMERCFLDGLPPALGKMPVLENEDGPTRAFIEVKSDDASEVPVPDMTDPLSELLVKLEKKSVHLIPYRSISKLVEEDKVLLL